MYLRCKNSNKNIQLNRNCWEYNKLTRSYLHSNIVYKYTYRRNQIHLTKISNAQMAALLAIYMQMMALTTSPYSRTNKLTHTHKFHYAEHKEYFITQNLMTFAVMCLMRRLSLSLALIYHSSTPLLHMPH